MTYEQSLEYIHSIPKFSRKLGNELLGILLDHLGNPQKGLKFIHVGGTNGKGSVSTMISEILISAGFKVGLFTSPYLVKFNERIRINGVPIGDEELSEIVEYVKEISERYDAKVSEFAFITAVALVRFKQCRCDFVVLEVGLGGRLDATNIIEKSEVTVLTSIGLDHCQYLGSTVDSVSKEKLGIVKPGCPVVLYPDSAEVVLQNTVKVCRDKNSELIIPDLPKNYNPKKSSFEYKGEEYSLAMEGEFQALNASCAIEAAKKLADLGYDIDSAFVKQGLANGKIEGRLERINNVIIDGAHNPQAIETLLKELETLHEPITFIVAVMEDKDCSAMATLLSKFAKKHGSTLILTQINNPRCLEAEKLKHQFETDKLNIRIAPSPALALKKAAKTDGIICICGSLYLAGEVKKLLSNKQLESR